MKKNSEEIEICEKCKVKMKVARHYQRMLEHDELGGDLTDGVESEYIAAELGGDSTEQFTVNVTDYECPKCHGLKIIESLLS